MLSRIDLQQDTIIIIMNHSKAVSQTAIKTSDSAIDGGMTETESFVLTETIYFSLSSLFIPPCFGLLIPSSINCFGTPHMTIVVFYALPFTTGQLQKDYVYIFRCRLCYLGGQKKLAHKGPIIKAEITKSVIPIWPGCLNIDQATKQ